MIKDITLKIGDGADINLLFAKVVALSKFYDAPVHFNFFRGRDEMVINVYPEETVEFCIKQFNTNSAWRRMPPSPELSSVLA